MLRFWTAKGRWQPLVAAVVAGWALALQMLLAGLATIEFAPSPASSPTDPFVICFGDHSTPADDQTPINHPPHEQHCVLCSVAAGSAAIVPTIAKDAVHRPLRVSIHWSTATIVPTRQFTPRLSQGPPRSA